MTRAGAKPPARRGPAPAGAPAVLLEHDLKNLAGRLEMLGQNLSANFDDPLFRTSALGVLSATAHHLAELARDLRQHEGRVVAKLRIDLNDVLQQALGDIRPDLAGKVELVESYREIPAVWGDSFLLRRAFACALENALHAMKGRGTISLATWHEVRHGRGRTVVEIADDGPGMTAEFVRDGLFRPHASTKPNGLGLGAYTIRQVAQLHGATLRVASVVGVGTRLRFGFLDE